MSAQHWYRIMNTAKQAIEKGEFDSKHFYEFYETVFMAKQHWDCGCDQCRCVNIQVTSYPQIPRYCKVIGQYCHKGHGDEYTVCKEKHQDCTGVLIN